MNFKKYSLIIILTFCIAFAFELKAQVVQRPNTNYRPPADHSFSDFMLNNWVINSKVYNYAGVVSQKHKFKIVFNDGTDTVINTKILSDSSQYYIQVEDKSVSKDSKDRFKKIYPNQTSYIVRMDKIDVPEYKGISNDSCWLFKTIDGRISAFTVLAEDGILEAPVFYVRKGTDPLVVLNEANLEIMISDNEKAYKLFKKKNYKKAIYKYNR